jgi:hypothetical protein
MLRTSLLAISADKLRVGIYRSDFRLSKIGVCKSLLSSSPDDYFPKDDYFLISTTGLNFGVS